jgi:hypothetical protein
MVGMAVGTAQVRAAAIVVGLTSGPLWSLEDARATSGIPREPGFYAWWAVPGAIPGIPAPSHPSEPFELLYVGIAPQDAVSTQRLRPRLCRQHISGNVASSTFRFGLGALLWVIEGWTPRVPRRAATAWTPRTTLPSRCGSESTCGLRGVSSRSRGASKGRSSRG